MGEHRTITDPALRAKKHAEYLEAKKLKPSAPRPVGAGSAYYRLDDFSPCSAHDPQRFVWYSSGCTYWTDDTSKLRKSKQRVRHSDGHVSVGGPPMCPSCGAVGFQTTAEKILDPASLAAHEAKGNPDYPAIFLWMKERCCPRYADAERAYRSTR